MKAHVLSVQYDFGGYDRGAEKKIPSYLTVVVQLGTKREIARVDRFFKERLGLLTQKRREQIFATMPAEVELEIVKTIKKKYHLYGVAAADLEQWLGRIEKG